MAYTSSGTDINCYIGCGSVQKEGGMIEETRPGDVVWLEANEKHWLCATPSTATSHIAIQDS